MKNTIATRNKHRRLKKAGRVLASVMVLLVLLVAAGVAYAWYSGNQPAPQPATAAATPSGPPAIKPVKPAANVPVGVSIQSLSSPIKPGASAEVSIKTLPQAKCTIAVSYNKEKTPIHAAGLVPKTADDFGMTSWKWVIDPAAPKGNWPVTVTCKKNKRSAVVTGDLVVKP